MDGSDSVLGEGTQQGSAAAVGNDGAVAASYAAEGEATSAAAVSTEGTTSTWGAPQGGYTTAASAVPQSTSHFNYSGKIVATEAFQMPPASRCFIIKPGSFSEVEQIYNSKAIYPPAATREKLRAAAKEGDVYVAISVNNSRALQGYGIIPKLDADDTGIIDGKLVKRKLSFDWQRVISMPFGSVSHVHNRLNGNQPVRMSRDGHELDRFAADQLVSVIRSAPEASLEELKERLAGVDELNPVLEYSDTSETCEKAAEPEPAASIEAPSSGDASASNSSAPMERGGHMRTDFKRPRDGEDHGHRRRHPAAFDLDLCDMTYEEYLEQYNIRKNLALDKFHASLAAAASTQMLPPPPMVQGHGFYPGPPQPVGMGMMYGGMGMPPRPHMMGGGMYMGGGGRGGGRGYYGGR